MAARAGIISIIFAAHTAAAQEPAPAPPWSVLLEGYAGLGLFATNERVGSHALGGGALELGAGRLQVGGFVEALSMVEEHAVAYGGLVGVRQPFRHWVELDASLGAGRRRFFNDEPRYGLGGYALSGWFGTLRAGVSDRLGGALGERAGILLVTSIDLTPHDIAWHFGPPDMPNATQGVHRVGGVSVTLAVTAGFDLAPQPVRPRR